METHYGYRSHKDSIRRGMTKVGGGEKKKTFTVVVMKYYTLPCTPSPPLPFHYPFRYFYIIYKMDINYLVCRVDGHERRGSSIPLLYSADGGGIVRYNSGSS